MNPSLRIIFDPPRDALFNMAADLLLLSQAHRTDEIILRLYQWKSPTITLGYMQKAEQTLHMKTLQKYHAQWVRRPTGGRAILHDGDITYSVIFGRHRTLMGESLQETYRIISECLVQGLQKAQICCTFHDSQLDSAAVRRETKLPCFLAPNREELMFENRKLVGSAQKRKRSGVLQHGSIPLTGAFRKLPFFTNISDTARRQQQTLLEQKCIALDEIHPELSVAKLYEYLRKGFEEYLQLTAEEKPWSPEEIQAITTFAGSEEFLTRYHTEL